MKKVSFVFVAVAAGSVALAASAGSTAQAEPARAPAADSAFVLKVDAPATPKGQKGVAKIHITPGAGYHMNKEYPTSLTFTTVPAGVSVDKLKLTSKDAARWEEQGGEFDVSYTAAQPGKKVVTGELKFAVCSANSCDPKRSSVSFEIDVK